jgi:RNA polymerase sigma-70 factor (ECF subfamily)
MSTRVDELRNQDAGPSGSTNPYAHLDDRMLVLDFQSGNGNRDPAFAEIHRRYSGLARHICYRILSDARDAEDASQETMLRVLQGLGRFNGRYRLQPWIAKIATNVSLDALRARARRPQNAESELIELDGEADDSSEPSALVDQLVERERIKMVLQELPDHHRAALLLREYEGRSHVEIGEALGVTPAQAKALIHRAKGSFRRMWDRSEREGGRLTGLAPLLLLPFRLSEWFRRLFGSATEAAAATSASPLAASTAVTGAERAAAAVVVVAVAATVGVGAVALRQGSRGDRVTPSPAPAVSAPVVDPDQHVSDKVAPRWTHHRIKRHAKHVKSAHKTAPVIGVAPVSPSPTAPPGPSPTETPPPSVASPPPAPEWTGAVSSSLFGGDVALALIDSRINGTVGHSFQFSQAAKGAFTDAAGQEQTVYTEYWGSANGPDGSANAWVILNTSAGSYRYDADLSLGAQILRDDGTYVYDFSGTFHLASSPDAISDESPVMPQGGKISVELQFWSNQTTLYGASVQLTEADPAPTS